jgi:hypothetical protein
MTQTKPISGVHCTMYNIYMLGEKREVESTKKLEFFLKHSHEHGLFAGGKKTVLD